MGRKDIVPSRKKVPDKQREHIRTYKSGKRVRVNPGNKKLAQPPKRQYKPSRSQPPIPSSKPTPKDSGKSSRQIAARQSREMSEPIKDSISNEKKEEMWRQYEQVAPDDFIGFIENQGVFGTGIATIPVCPLCGGKIGEVLMSRDFNKPFPGQPVVSKVCKKCFEKYLIEGVMVQAVDENGNPTSRMLVGEEDAIKKILKDLNPDLYSKTKNSLKYGRTVRMDEKLFEKIFGDVINGQEK